MYSMSLLLRLDTLSNFKKNKNKKIKNKKKCKNKLFFQFFETISAVLIFVNRQVSNTFAITKIRVFNQNFENLQI